MWPGLKLCSFLIVIKLCEVEKKQQQQVTDINCDIYFCDK